MITPRTAALLTLLSLWSPALASDLIGQASVIDGDTLEIHGTRIRLWGIDAPESTQLCRGEDSLRYRCGAQAANDLDAFIARRPVDCAPMNLDQYGRTVATCSAGGADLGEWLVRSGLGLDWPQFSKGRYEAAQRDAERVGRDIWKGSYVEPWLYRACIRASGNPTNCSDDATSLRHSVAWKRSCRKRRRKVYNLVEIKVPHFRLGATICARKGSIGSFDFSEIESERTNPMLSDAPRYCAYTL